MKRILALILTLSLALALSGCGGTSSTANATAQTESSASTEVTDSATEQSDALPDGVYMAEFVTDSGMFHVNEACDGKGTLTVENGTMILHVSLVSKKIQNLFVGTAEDAQKEGAELLAPTLDTVTYSDGMSEVVHGFDIPVQAIGEDFALALIGEKGTWYDHTVSVQNPEPYEQEIPDTSTESTETSTLVTLEDGVYTCAVTLEGGTGRASVQSPAVLTVQDGVMTAELIWSSNHYDYMIVNEETLLPDSTKEHSIFTIPVAELDAPLTVIADTTAMSQPHEVEYTLTFDSATITAQ